MNSQIAFSEASTKYNGLTPVGMPAGTMIRTTVIGLHVIFGLVPVYRATLESTLDAFSREAIKNGASKVRVVNATQETGIWYLPPVTFLLTPVFYTITGEVYR